MPQYILEDVDKFQSHFQKQFCTALHTIYIQRYWRLWGQRYDEFLARILDATLTELVVSQRARTWLLPLCYRGLLVVKIGFLYL